MNEIELLLAKYSNTVVTITVPIFGCNLHGDYIKTLAIGAGFTVVETPISNARRRYPRPTTKTFIATYNHYQSAMCRQFTKSLEQIFNPSFLTFTVTEQPMFKDIWALYEHLVGSHDWYYMMSDDHGVWSAGEHAKNQIHRIREYLYTIDRLRADDLYNKHCPYEKENKS